MKIANIILTSQNGGAEQVFIDYIAIFKDLGHEVLAITKDDAPYAKKVEELEVKLEKVSNNLGYYDIFSIKKIRKILKDFKADAVFAHAGRAIVLARKAIAGDDILLSAINHSNNVKRSIGSDLVICVNKEIFFKTVDKGQSEDKTMIIQNAIDLSVIKEDFDFSDLDKKEEVVIGIMSRFDRTKGIDRMLRSLKELKEKSDKKIILKIAGNGEEELNIKKLAKELDLEKNVEFLGWITNKKSFFNSIDIFCLPSSEETFGLVVIEAMKYRKPIVSTNCDGPKEIIRDRIDGLLVDLNSKEGVEKEIANKILEIIKNKDLKNKIIENSLIRIKEKFSYQALKEKLKEIVG